MRFCFLALRFLSSCVRVHGCVAHGEERTHFGLGGFCLLTVLLDVRPGVALSHSLTHIY